MRLGEKMDEERKTPYLCITDETARRVVDQMPDSELIEDLASWFKIFGDATRVRILYALFSEELCVGDLAALLGLTQTAVSHQLRILRTSKLIKSRKAGKTVFYSLADDHVRVILDQGTIHLQE